MARFLRSPWAVVSPIRPDLLPSPSARSAEQVPRVSEGFSDVMLQRLRASSTSSLRAVPRVEIEARRTELRGSEAASALSNAWTRVIGERPSADTTAVLTAQWAHETARGASMFNYNFGGIKGQGPSGLSVAQRTKEGFGASERQIVDHFRAYGSADEGALDYVRLLKARYPAAVEAARQGDPEGFVRALKARGYFTGDPQAYVRSVGSMSRQALAQGFDALSATAPGAPSSGIGANLDKGIEALEVTTLNPEFLATQAPAARATPFIDALRMADEISRAALRISASDGRSRRDDT